ncbi:unnamed protein product, partial [Scytosiphon promiscuus]
MALIKVCFEQALAEYFMERLLLRDRAGPQSIAGPGDGADQDAAAAAAAATEMAAAAGAEAAAAAGGPGRRPSFERNGDKEGRGPPVRHPAPKNVKAVCTILSRLTDEAAGGTSPVTQRIVADENIPGWALPAVAADLTQAICHQHSKFFKSTTALNLSRTTGERPKTAILSSFAPARPVCNSRGNSTVDPGQYIIALGLEFDGAPKTHVREDLEEAFLSAGGAREDRQGGGPAEGKGKRPGGGGKGGAASGPGASGVGVAGSSGNYLQTRPTSSFALDPPHLKRQQPLLGTASGSGSGSGPGSGSSAGGGGG